MQWVSTSSPSTVSHGEVSVSQQITPVHATRVFSDGGAESRRNCVPIVDHDLFQCVAKSDCAVALARTSGKDYTWVITSSPMEELTGYARGELLGKNFRLLEQNCDEDMEGNATLNEAFNSDSPCSFMRTCRRKTGELFCIRVLVLSLAADFSLKLFILFDITDNVLFPFNTANEIGVVSKALPCVLTMPTSVGKDKNNDYHQDVMSQVGYGFQKIVGRVPPTYGVSHKARAFVREICSSQQARTHIAFEQTQIDFCILTTGMVVGLCLGLWNSTRRHH